MNHATAIKRNKLSTPMSELINRGYISGNEGGNHLIELL